MPTGHVVDMPMWHAVDLTIGKCTHVLVGQGWTKDMQPLHQLLETAGVKVPLTAGGIVAR